MASMYLVRESSNCLMMLRSILHSFTSRKCGGSSFCAASTNSESSDGISGSSDCKVWMASWNASRLAMANGKLTELPCKWHDNATKGLRRASKNNICSTNLKLVNLFK